MLRRIYMATVLLFAGLAMISIVGVFSPSPAGALTSVPAKMNFQGRLTNNAGNTLPNGTYNMRFRIYNAATGGSALWTESRLISASAGVTVTNGLFSVQLGDNTPIPASLFLLQTQGTLYFEIELPTPASATSSSPVWTEGAMSPRNQLAASAYAFNSESLDGLDSEAFAQVGGTNTFTGTNTFRSSTNSTASFAIQDSAGTDLLIADTTNDRIYIGEPTADANTTFLAVDSYNGGTSDPVGGFNGSIYYNTTSGKFRCYEAGAWKNCVATVPARTTVTLAANVTNSSTTLANLTNFSFPVSAGVPYRFEALITYDAAATTTGSRFLMTGPAFTNYALETNNTNATTGLSVTSSVSAYGLPSVASAASNTANNLVTLTGRIVPSANGTMQVQFASEVGLSAITAKPGSILTYWVDQ